MQPLIGVAPFHAAQGSLTTNRTLIWAVAVGLILFLCVPLFQAAPNTLDSDQSLYTAEALNLAEGRGPVYPTGEPITHRGPIYPAVLAMAFSVAGASLESAYAVTAVVTVVNALLAMLLGRTLFGTWGGIVAGVTVAASPYLRGMGTTLFLDGMQVTLFLASLLTLWWSQSKQSVLGYMIAGMLLGVSFLIKEASILFLPLPLVLGLVQGFDSGWRKALTAWFGGFVLATSWWWIWVYVHTSELFLLGPLEGPIAVTFLVCVGVSILIYAALIKFVPEELGARIWTWAAAVGLLFIWNAAFYIGLERIAYAHDSDLFANVSDYMRSVVFSNLQPFPLIVAAFVWALICARHDRRTLFVVTPALLSFSWFIHVADRGVALRDVMPLIYMAYVGLGGAVAALVRWGASIDLGRRVSGPALGTLAGGFVVLTYVLWSGTTVSQAAIQTPQDDWENPLPYMTAEWISENVEPGTSILSSRLYYTHVYFLTDGDYPIHQLPTVEAQLNFSSKKEPVTRRSTLFRWENHMMPSGRSGESWVYLTFHGKGYFVGLAEDDLLTALREREAGYLVMSTIDAGFSLPSLNRYFEDNPAFELVHVDAISDYDQSRIYRVDLAKLEPQSKPTMVRRRAYELVAEQLGSTERADGFFERLNPTGFELVRN